MKKILTLTCILAIIATTQVSAQRIMDPHDPGTTDKDLPAILTFGLVHPGRQQAAIAVAAKYGFTYRAAAGCVVTEELMDSIANHNKTIYAMLDKKHGAGWTEKMEKEIEQTMIKTAGNTDRAPGKRQPGTRSR